MKLREFSVYNIVKGAKAAAGDKFPPKAKACVMRTSVTQIFNAVKKKKKLRFLLLCNV